MSSRSSKNPWSPRRTTAWSSTSSTRIRAGASRRDAVHATRPSRESIAVANRRGDGRPDRASGPPGAVLPAGSAAGRHDARCRPREPPRRAAAPARGSPSPRRIEVNGIRTSRKTSTETRKPGEQEHDAQELAQLEQLRGPGAVERVGDRREEGAERDQQRRRHPRVEPAGGELSRGARERGDEVHGDRDGAMHRLNRNWSPGWLGSSEYGEHALLGHEHVGREQRAQQQRQRRR